jgi:glycosyltransferase involved in cell wall biosynthesis
MPEQTPLRLGVYSDLVYKTDGESFSTDLSFIRFPTSLPPRVDEVVVFGRLHPQEGREAYALPRDGVRFVALPHYPSVFAVRALLGAVRRSCRVFSRELRNVDAVLLYGPAPFAVLFALLARRRGVPVVLGVRQDYPRYIGGRLPSRAWTWALGVAWLLELAYRRLARSSPTVAIGDELASHYRKGKAPVLASGLSLVRDADIVDERAALAKDWSADTLRIVTVGRLDPEKNPVLLADVLADLRSRDARWELDVVGTGPLHEAVVARARELGVGDALHMRGYAANGPELWALYRNAHAFLHVSLTEGLPQVLFEAQAAGTPIVATAVGGVGAALRNGELGLLVPPRDAHAAARALERLRDDDALRERLVRASLEAVRHETLDAQLDRLAEFVRAAVD